MCAVVAFTGQSVSYVPYRFVSKLVDPNGGMFDWSGEDICDAALERGQEE